jgi:hypothetical protein
MKAKGYYDSVTIDKLDGNEYVRVIGRKATIATRRNGYACEPYEWTDEDTVTVHLPRRDVFAKEPGTILEAVVNWSGMGDRSPEVAAAYAALIARAAKIAAKENADLPASILRQDAARDRMLARIKRERAKAVAS